MVKELPLFALNMVVFPDEELNIHIFEPQYKELINDCLRQRINFGIPSHVMNKIEYGTEVKIVEVVKTYEDGRMDIKTKGMQVFLVKDYQNPWKDKNYAGGSVELQPVVEEADLDLNLDLIELCRELYEWLRLKPDFDIMKDNILYDVVHKIGLKPEEEYILLKMKSEVDRQKYVIEHLKKLIPALERAEKARERIKMNGNFQNLDPFKF